MSTLEVTATGAAADAVTTHVPTLVQDRVASRIFAKDHTLWGPAAEEESAKRLNWTGLPRTSRHLIGEVAALREELSQLGYDRVVLCGMGGSSLAPEVICATAGVPIDVLDSSDPDVVRAALTDLDRTVVVVSSKSGSTVETDSQRRAFEQAFRDAGLDPTARMVIVTDPGSPLDADARAAGFRVVNADPQVGGRYSALTAFGLVPSALAGADVEALLDDAEAVSDLLAADDDANPALRLAAAMAGTQPLRDKLVLVDDGTENVGFGAWAEQLIAESTGKDGTGILPVVAIGSAPATLYADGTVVRLVATDSDSDGDQDTADAGESASSAASLVTVAGPLGAQIMLWETATAVAGRLLDISPFDQPDVESAKAAARELLDAGIGAGVEPAFTDGAVEVTALGGDWLGDASTVDAAVDTLLGLLDDQQGYIAVMAYLDRLGDADLELVARDLFDRTGRPATFGWGPRFLHSTGQYHKGGPSTGVYLQVTTAPVQDLEVPGREFTFGEFIAAQAGGDAAVLAEHGRPVLRLHLTAHDEGLEQVRAALSRGRA
ncbi:MAG TPA: glucose-6-phosphate isomerase [Ornithinibacter sp.]|jgi:glucose-6-phosphate isomerase|uniref:glucose-6-phosphate isomerase n=1 Tax=Ornithinibacter sp. TaxID=2862748 RepID=UPI001B5D23C7|nr:glucose-6-phosphate isomerase [Ornithinibacter sp.]MBP6526025.1 glucose-6-phosphate isomerase [Dermatophilaceae bacterium]HQV83682.1 glucose-6-phosphate isomerase [Ornithinibacter sp.]HQX86580.1 glucose-6-phosphate isomerase [Ornithinibacter sp.]HQZ09394.1 glucose-6-phosphate isomerase [Ornithinibacter sp.]HRA25759.1 glucose-6-phosphate isomerase [Ornithinibacter sp.]